MSLFFKKNQLTLLRFCLKSQKTMKKPLSLFAALCLGGILASGTASAAPIYYLSTNYTAAQSVDLNGVVYDFNQFDTNLGTLTSVTFTIISSTNTGYFTVTSGKNSTATLSANPKDNLVVQDYFNTNNPGSYLSYSTPTNVLTTDPDTSSDTIIQKNTTETFSLNPSSQTLVSDSSSLSFSISDVNSLWSTFFEGNNKVSFYAYNNPYIELGGSGGTFNATGIVANTALMLTYTYAVPEPSTYVLFGLGGLALVVAYRRKRAA